ncbi:MAG: single-stranded-DNA-specific exonuclease RecJ [Rhodothermaceae bacterium]|nr:single-stranded-DNA-specific exonuclease RecJ [Rhodothermaceae bacterium]
MSLRWVYAKPDDGEAVFRLRRELGVSETIARLLAIRGVTTFNQAKAFFRPTAGLMHDPFLMKDMGKAASRLAHAIRNHERVLVYGDYDVDGTTATAIMYSFLKNFGVHVDYYIPHRFKDGYGISIDGIEEAKKSGAKLIVSVDCGITAVEEAKMAKKLGLDLIICDHHNAGPEIPDCVAVLDPKRPGCTYPFDGLSGAGVGFKLTQATLKELGLPMETANQYLDLVALSIASDIVPIVDENRVLMRLGLEKLNTNPRIGLRVLADHIKMGIGKISTSQIVFSIGPRINAAGRMGDAKLAVELMITDSENEAITFATELEAVNMRRRDTDNLTMEKAMVLIDSHYDMDKSSSVVLHDPEWHLGVIGIVASRLVDIYCRPTVMLSTVDGMVKGSARSIKGFNIYNALKECDDLLVQFGGHEFAAGLTLDAKDLDAFKERFEEIVMERLGLDEQDPELIIDADLNLGDIKPIFWKQLSQFEPYGPQNLKPIFVSRNLRVVGNPTVVGNGHLKMKVAQNGTTPLDAIGFNMHKFLPDVRECGEGGLNLAYVLEENTWNNRTNLQMRLKDIKIGDEALKPQSAGSK